MQVTTTDAGWKVKLTKRERKQLDNAADVITLLTELPCGFKGHADTALAGLIQLLAALDGKESVRCLISYDLRKEKPRADTPIQAKTQAD